jgi:hypothetical protein
MLLAGLVFAAALTLQPCALAKDEPGKGKANQPRPGNWEKPVEKSEGRAGDTAVIKDGFTAEERSKIQACAWGDGTPRRLPPGLAKKVGHGRGLPPGWEKKCVRGEIMPQEVFERCHPLPPELVIKLPPSPVGTVTVVVEGKVARLVRATLEILDVFDVRVRL